MAEYSLSPSGEKFPLPTQEDYAAEYQRLERLAAEAREEGKEVVVVMGVGFVGAVMAAIVADTTDAKGRADQVRHRLPAPQHAQLLEDRRSSTAASRRSRPRTPRSTRMIARCVLEKKTLTATYNSDCLKLADCVVVDVQCDYAKQELGNMRTGETDMAALEATLQDDRRAGSPSAASSSSRRPSRRARPSSSPGRSSRRRSRPAACRARRCWPTASSA